MRLVASELRLRRLSLAVWTVSVVLLMLIVVGFYPSVRDDPSLNSLYEGLGPSAQALLGGSDLTSPIGYLNTQAFAYFVPLVLLVFGLGRAVGSLAGEEEDRTLDLLLAQPISRASAYLQKAAAVGVGLVVLGLAVWVPLVAFDSAVRFDLPLSRTVAACVQMTLLCLALSLVAQGVAAATGRRSVGLAAVSGYAIVSYLAYGLSGSVTWLQHVKPLTVWRWYLGNDPLANGLGAAEVLVLTGTCAAALAAGSWAFGRRDLRA